MPTNGEEYKKQVDDLAKQINEAKEALFRAVSREDYQTASALRDQIKADQERFMDLLTKYTK